MKHTKFLILALMAISLLFVTGCAPKATMSDLMKEKGYGEQSQDPFGQSEMLNVNSLDIASRMDPNYGWKKTISPKPGEISEYAKKIVTWRLEGESYFNSLKEFKEASKSIHPLVQANLAERDISLSEGQSLYYYTLKSFEFDKDLVVSDMSQVMQVVLKDNKEKSITPVLLVGYADEVGTDQYNLVLSEKRAQALELEFEKLGLNTDKLEILAGGETTDYGSHVENRRGVLVCIVK